MENEMSSIVQSSSVAANKSLMENKAKDCVLRIVFLSSSFLHGKKVLYELEAKWSSRNILQSCAAVRQPWLHHSIWGGRTVTNTLHFMTVKDQGKTIVIQCIKVRLGVISWIIKILIKPPSTTKSPTQVQYLDSISKKSSKNMPFDSLFFLSQGGQ